jgi:ATP-dependent exoDNAse (exonuclease V), alpha subunit - helicase superfamily I member
VAIFHLSVKTISRSAGRSATAAAAYRAGVKISDERTGEMHDYTRKGGVESAELVLPAGAPEWAADRELLWNAAEQAETRKNSTVAREFEIALPEELTAAGRQRLALDVAREIVERHGCAADVAIHAPGADGDHRNHHAHILLTTRRLGPEGFTEKTRELDDQKTGPQLVTQWRERFASLQNEHLHQAGIEARVDHRRLKEQGVDREPTRHLGPAASGYERRTGEPSRKRLDFEAEAAERLARAKAAGDLERASRQIDRSILDLSGDLEAAKAERLQAEQERARAGMEAARARFEAHKMAEAGKQQAREAFERFKAEQAAKQQAEVERQRPKPEKGRDYDYDLSL